MNNVQYTSDISESAAHQVIFTACRANSEREARSIAGWDVSFTEMLDGCHMASVRAPNKARTLVATAVVDGFDI